MITFKKWFENNLKDCAEDIANYGADAGYPYITYTNECVELYNQFEDEIWDMLYEDVQNFGYKNIPEFIATFRRQDMTHTSDQFKNLLVWYACERIARGE